MKVCPKCKVQMKYGVVCGKCKVELKPADLTHFVGPDTLTKLSSHVELSDFNFKLSQFIPEGQMFSFPDEMRRGIIESIGIPRHLFWPDCRCPFSLFDEFDQWFEWRRRVYLEKESSGQVTGEMTNWNEAIRSSCEIIKFRSHFHDAQAYAMQSASFFTTIG